MAKEQGSCWDPRYEFNAPRFYDFKATHEDSEDDVWFDTAETAGLPLGIITQNKVLATLFVNSQRVCKPQMM
jgi:hypothetical protein